MKSARSRLFVLYTDFEAQIIIQFWDSAWKMCGRITRVPSSVPEAKIKEHPAAREWCILSALHTFMSWLFAIVVTTTHKCRQHVRNNRKLVFTLRNSLEINTRLNAEKLRELMRPCFSKYQSKDIPSLNGILTRCLLPSSKNPV